MRALDQFLWTADPVAWAGGALGITCDRWQASVLRSTSDALILPHRQAGKTLVSCIAALHIAKFQPGSLTLLLAPSLRQSKESLATLRRLLRKLEPAEILESDNALSVELSNSSRIIALPGADPNTIRGYSAPQLIVEDEAAWVSDDTHEACAPMLLISKGRHLLLSTPGGMRGHLYQHWISGNPDWERFRLSVYDNSRIDPQQLEKLKRKTPAHRWKSEYLCEWSSSADQMWSSELIATLSDPEVKPLFSPTEMRLLEA